jgi:threonyl-tRNA synthetase
MEYAKKVQAALRAKGLRVDIDISAEKLGAKIRSATLQKVPYQVVVGPRDEAAGTVSVRSRTAGDLGAMTVDELIGKLAGELEG